MGQVIVIAVFLILVILAFSWARKKASVDPVSFLPPTATPPTVARGGPLEGLAVGAVVAHDGHDYVVRGEIRFNEEGAVWSEYHLDAGQDVKTWLSVDVSAGTSVAFWQAVRGAGDLSPGRGSVTHEGRTYKKVESGKAAFVTLGTTGLPPSGNAAYADYRAEGGRMLGFERWSPDGSWEVSTGTEIQVHQLEIRPAGQAARGTA